VNAFSYIVQLFIKRQADGQAAKQRDRQLYRWLNTKAVRLTVREAGGMVGRQTYSLTRGSPLLTLPTNVGLLREWHSSLLASGIGDEHRVYSILVSFYPYIS